MPANGRWDLIRRLKVTGRVSSLQNLSTSLSMVWSRNDGDTDGSTVPRSGIEAPTGLRCEHYHNLMPYVWSIAIRQAGMKNPDQERINNLPSLL